MPWNINILVNSSGLPDQNFWHNRSSSGWEKIDQSSGLSFNKLNDGEGFTLCNGKDPHQPHEPLFPLYVEIKTMIAGKGIVRLKPTDDSGNPRFIDLSFDGSDSDDIALELDIGPVPTA